MENFININTLSNSKMPATVNIKLDVINDLIRLKNEFDLVIESLELMTDKDFMTSYQKSLIQVEKREFDDWDEI